VANLGKLCSSGNISLDDKLDTDSNHKLVFLNGLSLLRHEENFCFFCGLQKDIKHWVIIFINFQQIS